MTLLTLRSAIVFLLALAGLLPTARGAMVTSADSGSSLSSGCLCTSDQPCWPSAATFAALESKLSQPLVHPLPTAWPCYPPNDPVGNCTEVNANSGDGNWRASQPGSLELANWEVSVFNNGTFDACFLNTSVTGVCDQGRVSVIGVDARTVADIQVAIRFAVEHSLRLVVKNTGHDFIGRSSGRGSFQVWTHNMKNITYDATFVPQGAPTGTESFEALTVGAGVQWAEAYAAVHQQNRQMVGGISVGGSVGAAGGWLMGGGHSFSSPTYGLGVDNVLEISIVLSTGEYLVTNAYQNSDLFWALRGGGGGTYGIVTSVTYITYPETPVAYIAFQANVTNSSVLPELIEGLLRYLPELTDAGWGGYGAISTQGISFDYFAPNMTNETVASSTAGWLNFTQSLAPYGVVSGSETGTFDSWYELIRELLFSGGVENGGYVIVSSRIISRESIANNASQIAPVLISCASGFNTVAGGKVSQFDPDSVGLNPAWRNAVTEMTCGASWDEDTSMADIQDMLEQLRGRMQELHDATPTDGAYLNEASPFEIDWPFVFFGDHYAKLKSIKDKYDPYRLFGVVEGVGSDEWNKNMTCRF